MSSDSQYFPLSPYHAYVHRNRLAAMGGPPLNQNPNNDRVFQPQPPPQPQPQTQPPQGVPLPPHPPYAQLICAAIEDLNEPDGSSKIAISNFIKQYHHVLSPAHGSLLTHHLKALKDSGTLTMVRKSYKLAPRSEIPPVAASASQPQKRGRGRPPKPRSEAQQQPINVQPITVQSNQLPVTRPAGEVTESGKRRPGRPRKDGAAPIVQAAAMGGIMKRRGRPPGRRAAGRQRKPKSVSATASVFPSFVANGARRRGRPKRVESSGTAAAPAGGEVVAVAPGMKRGRGRPPKIGGVMNRIITKPKQGRGRPAGRPRKNTPGAQEPAYGELKRKLDLFKEKAKGILNGLKIGITSGDNQAVVQATQDLEVLIPLLTDAPQPMEEEEEAAPQPQGEEEGEERGGEQGQAQTQTQTQTLTLTLTEAEAMQEALF